MQTMKELRCSCGRLLARVDNTKASGVIEIKCERCKNVKTFRGTRLVEKYSEIPRSVKIDRKGI